MPENQGDGRSIDNPEANPTDPVRSDESQAPVEGEQPGDAGSAGESVSEPGEGLVTEEGVNERD